MIGAIHQGYGQIRNIKRSSSLKLLPSKTLLWTKQQQPNAGITVTNKLLKKYNGSTEYFIGICYTNQMYDLTNYKTLRIKGTTGSHLTNRHYTTSMAFGYGTNLGDYNYHFNSWEKYWWVATGTTFDIKADLSSATGMKYICFWAASGDFEINFVELS